MSARKYDVFQKAELPSRARAYIADEMPHIGGWLSEHEAAIFCLIDGFQKEQGIEGYLAELGVWQGRGALLLHALSRPGEVIYAIDIFDLRDRSHSHFNDPEIFRANCRRLGAESSVRVLTIDTASTPGKLREAVPSQGCRIFHVDGGHEYVSVKKDMMFAASVLNDGGVLACDDVFATKFPGVTQALFEMLIANPHLVLFAISSKKAWIATRKYAAEYRKYILKSCPGAKFRRSTFMGKKVLIMP